MLLFANVKRTSATGLPFPAPAVGSGTSVSTIYPTLSLSDMTSLAIQYAVAMGLRVVAIDTGEEKRLLSLSLGAEAWIDFRESTDLVADVIAATGGGAHAAIVASGSSAAYTQAIAYLRTRGYMMVVGLARDVVVSLPVILVSARVRIMISF